MRIGTNNNLLKFFGTIPRDWNVFCVVAQRNLWPLNFNFLCSKVKFWRNDITKIFLLSFGFWALSEKSLGHTKLGVERSEKFRLNFESSGKLLLFFGVELFIQPYWLTRRWWCLDYNFQNRIMFSFLFIVVRVLSVHVGTFLAIHPNLTASRMVTETNFLCPFSFRYDSWIKPSFPLWYCLINIC